MKNKKLIWIVVLVLVIIGLFAGIKFGWKLFGFKHCINPDSLYVSSCSIDENTVEVKGMSLNSALKFSGYTYEIEENTLKIGLKYDLIFGDSGEFEVCIDTENTPIEEVVFVGDGNTKQIN